MSVVRLDIHVDQPIDTAVLYTSIQVWRSPDRLGVSSPYVEIAAESQTNAFLDGGEVGPWDLNGLSITITVDAGPATVVQFAGSALVLSDVINTINEAFPGLASESGEDTGLLRLTSPTYGTPSSIQVTASTAATRLGLTISKVNGKGAYPLLAQTTEEYEFVDFDGDDAYWYKTRFYNTKTGAVSEFSAPQRGAVPDVVPESSLVLCFVYLADGTGSPIVGRRVILIPTGQVQITNDVDQVYGILSSVDRITLITDDAGYAETNLVRGQTFKMFIEGTTFHREVAILAVGAELNLLTAAAAADDPFTIVETPPLLIRVV